MASIPVKYSEGWKTRDVDADDDSPLVTDPADKAFLVRGDTTLLWGGAPNTDVTDWGIEIWIEIGEPTAPFWVLPEGGAKPGLGTATRGQRAYVNKVHRVFPRIVGLAGGGSEEVKLTGLMIKENRDVTS